MKKLSSFLLSTLFLFSTNVLPAQISWAPTNAPTAWDRYDDTYFINPDTGWAVTLFDSSYSDVYQWATIIKTTDGGISWQKMLDSSRALFRDIAFVDAQTGFIGLLQPYLAQQDSIIMYQTRDGGNTWQPVTNLPGPKNAGICGMRVINDSTVYAVGRYSGPAGFYKTTNRGNTWSYTNMSSYATGLVDVFFFNADTGFTCGIKCAGNSYFPYGNATVLMTTDGGNTWQVKKLTTRPDEWCWKMSFPSRNTGYASIESGRTVSIDSQFCLKTTDGGLTWNDFFVCQQPTEFNNTGGFDVEGIGFINDSVGWLGGRNNEVGLNPAYIYKTINGGLTWNPDYWGENINRFRFMSDSLAYFSGKSIYKYSAVHVPLAVSDISGPTQLFLYPNPANSNLTVKGEQVDMLSIFATTGQLIAEIKHPLNNKIDISYLHTGLYLIQVQVRGNSWNLKWEKD